MQTITFLVYWAVFIREASEGLMSLSQRHIMKTLYKFQSYEKDILLHLIMRKWVWHWRTRSFRRCVLKYPKTAIYSLYSFRNKSEQGRYPCSCRVAYVAGWFLQKKLPPLQSFWYWQCGCPTSVVVDECLPSYVGITFCVGFLRRLCAREVPFLIQGTQSSVLNSILTTGGLI